MKWTLTLLCTVSLVSGCSSGSSETALDGIWVSSCHPLVYTDDGSFIADVIDTYNFSNGTYTLESQSYTDNTCTVTTNGTDLFEGDYTLLETAIASDGESVTKIALTQSSPNWPSTQEPIEIEQAYRIVGDELFFATIEEDNTIELFTDYTFMRQ